MSRTATFEESLALQRETIAPRRLGSVFPAPRNLYMLYLPLLMLGAGLACWVLPIDFMLMVGSVALGGVSLYIFFALVVQQAPLRISNLLVTTLGLGYGLGAANTWFSLPRSGQTLGEYLHKDPSLLTHTMGSTLIALSILLAVGEMVEKPLFGEEFELQFPQQSIVFISIGVVLLFVAYATGSLDYMGATHGESGQLGLFASFSAWLIGTLFAVTLVAALNAKKRSVRLYLMLLTAIQFVLEIPIGRRSLIYTVVLALIALRLGRFRFHWSWFKRIVIGILVSGMLYAASIGFYYLRLAGFSKTRIGIVERVTLAIQYFETKDYADVQKQFSQNVQTRTFILGFLAELDAYSTKFTPGYGEDLENQFLAAVPAFIYPAKYTTDLAEESLANKLFGSTYWDEANSILTAGAVDFGVLGMIVYPLLITYLLRAFLEFVGQSLPTFVAVFIILSAIGRLLQPENTVTDYFVIVRNSLLFGALVWFFLALPAFHLRKDV